jgi:hypothetical protein
MFMLLLIGMGPKISLGRFLDLTRELEGEQQRKIAQQMVRTSVGTACYWSWVGS